MPARLRLRFTGRSIRTKKFGLHADGDGLNLQVTKNGAWSWILRTMVRGKRRDIRLGGLLTVSLSEARESALPLRKIARSGGDPWQRATKRIPPSRRSRTRRRPSTMSSPPPGRTRNARSSGSAPSSSTLSRHWVKAALTPSEPSTLSGRSTRSGSSGPRPPAV